MKPESMFRTVLWFLGPFLAWFVGRFIIQRIESWHAAQTEANAKASLTYLYQSIENPPTLLSSVAYLVCFLPLPIFLTALVLTLYFSLRPSYPPVYPFDPHLAQSIRHNTLSFLSFCIYGLFGVLTVYGIKVAYWLRHGEARYAENYRAGVQKKINRLKKKFPQLNTVGPA